MPLLQARLVRAASLALAAALLSGCAAVSTLWTAGRPLDAYVLTPVQPAAAAARTGRSVVVEPFDATGAVATDRILIKPHPLQAQYLSGARWVDSAPDLMRGLLIESLQNTGAFSLVGRGAGGLFPDYTIVGELLDFQAELDPGEGPAYWVRVRLAASMVRESDGQIVAARTFASEVGADSPETLAIVAAFDAATDAVLGDAVAWVLGTLGLRS